MVAVCDLIHFLQTDVLTLCILGSWCTNARLDKKNILQKQVNDLYTQSIPKSFHVGDVHVTLVSLRNMELIIRVHGSNLTTVGGF